MKQNRRRSIIGYKSRNADFLVHFVELRGQTFYINNVDFDKYGFYDVIDDIYNFVAVFSRYLG